MPSMFIDSSAGGRARALRRCACLTYLMHHHGELYRKTIAQGEARIGKLAEMSTSTWDAADNKQLPPIAHLPI